MAPEAREPLEWSPDVWDLRRLTRKLTRSERHRQCGRPIANPEVYRVQGDHGSSCVSEGWESCNRRNECPTCGRRWGAKEASRIVNVHRHYLEAGYVGKLVTLTQCRPHGAAGERELALMLGAMVGAPAARRMSATEVDWMPDDYEPRDVRDAVVSFFEDLRTWHEMRPETKRRNSGNAWQTITNQRWFRAAVKAGIRYVRGVETTLGMPKRRRSYRRWHPHIHVLFWVPATMTPLEWSAFVAQIRETWSDEIALRMGEEWRPSLERGVDVRDCDAPTYIAKLGLEIVSAATKDDTKNTDRIQPWQLPRIATMHEDDRVQSCAREEWDEYLEAFAGLKRVRFDGQSAKMVFQDPEIERDHVATIPHHPARALRHHPEIAGALFCALAKGETVEEAARAARAAGWSDVDASAFLEFNRTRTLARHRQERLEVQRAQLDDGADRLARALGVDEAPVTWRRRRHRPRVVQRSTVLDGVGRLAPPLSVTARADARRSLEHIAHSRSSRSITWEPSNRALDVDAAARRGRQRRHRRRYLRTLGKVSNG